MFFRFFLASEDYKIEFDRLLSEFHGYVIWPEATEGNPADYISDSSTSDQGDLTQEDNKKSWDAAYVLKVGCNVDLNSHDVNRKIRVWQKKCAIKVNNFFQQLDSSGQIYVAEEVTVFFLISAGEQGMIKI